jgi:2-methylcitrate dehydratase PrpD
LTSGINIDTWVSTFNTINLITLPLYSNSNVQQLDRHRRLMVSKYLLNLCRFISEMVPTNIPPHVLDHAKMVLLDTLGVIIAGSKAEEVRQTAQKVSVNFQKEPGVTCPGKPETLDPLNAALINGMAGSTLEYEEGNSRAMGHPAIQMVPAIVAESESIGQSGPNLLAALIGGYETACRISRAASIRRGLHPTGTWGIVGCALAIGILHHKKSEELFEIANIASSYAFSPYVKNSFVGQNVACTFAGLTNYLGLLTNTFFENGIQANPDSFQMTFSKFLSDELNSNFLDEKLGDAYAITENYFKPYPTCRFTHPALEALKSILKKQPVKPQDVNTIKITSFKEAVHAGGSTPANLEAMRFSVPYLIAAMLLRGQINLATLDNNLLHDSRLADLAGKVELVYSPEYEQLRPEKNPAKVTIELKDGRTLSHEILNCFGDPSNPLPSKDICEKFLFLTEPIIGQSRSGEFLKRVMQIENENDVRPLMALLRPNSN